VIGDPTFYGRFGFEPAAGHRVTSRFDVASHFFMVRAARPAPERRGSLGRPCEPGGLREPGGIGLDYPAAFDGG
jgi:hypothetical protein